MKILDLYITKVCNLNCEYCYVDLQKEEDSFNYETFSQRIDLLEYDQIRFLGGEPLLRYKEIKNIINSVLQKKPDTIFSVITNGLLLNEDKLSFFKENNISVTISIHKKGAKKILEKSFLLNLYKYRNNLGFVILYNYNNIKLGTSIFNLLVKLGFKNFSISPLADINRDDSKLDALKKELNIIKKIIQENKDIEIPEVKANYLKNVSKDNFCKKHQTDKSGIKKLCTRFDKERILKKSKNIDYIHDLFDKNNSCSTCDDKWFCACPIGWYLDNKDLVNDDNLSIIFHKLNKIFIEFYRDVAKIKDLRNFLTKGINELRFNLTQQCNLRCNYCYLNFSNKTLDYDKAKNIIDYLIIQDGEEKTISFFGGEPLLEFELFKKIVEYTKSTSKKHGKKLNYKIATNGLLLDYNKINFLKENDFHIHLSFNGTKEINDATRDNSSLKFIKIVNLLKEYKNVVILMVIFPNYINELKKSVNQIKLFGFNKIIFEIYLGNKYIWGDEQYEQLKREFVFFKESGSLGDIDVLNLKKNKNTYLDISTEGKINDNSLEFFSKDVNFFPKKYFDKILYDIFG